MTRWGCQIERTISALKSDITCAHDQSVNPGSQPSRCAKKLIDVGTVDLGNLIKCSRIKVEESGCTQMNHESESMAKHERRIAGLIHKPKLTWVQVNEIRRKYVPHSRTCGLKALADEFGVSMNNIHKILRGQTWKVSEGDKNVHPPLAGVKTPQQISKTFARLGGSFDNLRSELRRLQRS